MMGLVIRLLSYAVRFFMFILLLVLICIIQLAITRANESLQIIYLRTLALKISHVQIFFNLGLQVENDMIILKT